MNARNSSMRGSVCDEAETSPGYSTRTQQELNKPSSPTIYRQRYMCRSEALSGVSVQVTESPGSRLHRGCRRFEPGRAHVCAAAVRGLLGPPSLRLQGVHKTFCPQKVRGNVLGRSADNVQTVRDVVESVEDQVPVQVECHARGGVPKHTLLLCALRRRDAGQVRCLPISPTRAGRTECVHLRLGPPASWEASRPLLGLELKSRQ